VEDLDELDRQAGQRVAEEGAKLAREAGFEQVEARAVKQETKAWRAIVGMAASESAQVTVLGAHGRSGVGRALLGSVSTAVLTHSHSPVLVVPDGTPEPLESDSLLVCFDGSEGAQRAVEAAGRLFPRRAVSVLTLWEPWVALAPVVAGMSVPAYSATDIDKVAQERSEELAAAGASVAEKAGLVPEPIRVEVGTGPLWKAVLDTAAQREAGAIVMGSRGMTGISAALGSVSHGVVHHSRLPVLVVPPEG
jgi:nucleotide-binding universal stress UspA family protein